MNEEIKKKWIAALTSGEYRKGKQALRDDDKFCCLGVLCDLHSKENKGIKRYKWTDCGIYLGESQFLPIEVMKWAELEEDEPRVGESRITSFNDGVKYYVTSDYKIRPHSFKEIAKLIKRYL